MIEQPDERVPNAAQMPGEGNPPIGPDNVETEVGNANGAVVTAPPECDPRLLSLLVCPFTRTSLGYSAARQELISRPERLAFPIRDGIPILVREEARRLDDSP